MCSSKTPVSMNKRRRPRKSRLSKPKKPKFLSLRRQFPPNEMPNDASATAAADSRQLDLFPLHPLNDDRESQDQAENVALFFSAADGSATTLTDLLDSNSSAVDSNSSSHADTNSSRVEYLVRYAYGEERAALVRTALRSKDRDRSEEKWVRYSEVVEKRKVKEEEVTSSAAAVPQLKVMSLKLDYEEIMNAWSDKGPLYVDDDAAAAAADPSSHQIVPDIKHHYHFLSHHEGSWESNNNSGGLWRVPEIKRENENEEEMKMSITSTSMGQRKASVLRYKEKRQNRLFSKKIRYQVRKLNAEKRPRLKGRFVKKS